MATAMRRFLRCAPMGATGAIACATSPPPGPQDEFGRLRLEMELAKLRPDDAARRQRWVEDDKTWGKLPARAWPPYQPAASVAPELRKILDAERCPSPGSPMSTKCTKATFDLATCRVFNSFEVAQGLQAYKAQASVGDLDGMVALGICLIEGIGGVPRDEAQGIQWLRRAADLDSAQGQVELGCILYNGTEDGLEEDEEAALALFRKAAERRHPHAMFMVADCLLEGCACTRDWAAAVPLLADASDQGHRGARQHLGQLLDGNWRGFRGTSDEFLSTH